MPPPNLKPASPTLRLVTLGEGPSREAGATSPLARHSEPKKKENVALRCRVSGWRVSLKDRLDILQAVLDARLRAYAKEDTLEDLVEKLGLGRQPTRFNFLDTKIGNVFGSQTGVCR